LMKEFRFPDARRLAERVSVGAGGTGGGGYNPLMYGLRGGR
jgi:hypothetical protein